MTPDNPSLVVEQRDSILWVRLNRPQAFNALTPDMVEQMDAALSAAEAPSVRALVITGDGPAFCAGADLKAVLEADQGRDAGAALKLFLERAGAVFSRLEQFPKPTIAALNGVTMAGGLEVALCCDFIVADPRARLGEGHAKYAQLPGGGGSVRLPRRIGVARAKYLMFTGELLSAATAWQWQLVDLLSEPENLRGCVEELVARCNDKSALGLGRMKRLLQQGLAQPLEVALRAEIDMCELHAHSHDRNEGLAAFAQKRQPRYLGA
ncbi:enoyl-CoA hydratase/isomerase family protein [Cupriavidus sp. D39]|uniref:enoyl-CoA hydratase/isomerase family protein n=1 Tax=Cupriavidus sp. D39 TaxID=2997877 RepID=UPI00226F4959|nr:enoyl-CoA hydratase/isomerase family protein [Cupriavidus sp. D39]MCY0854671.1 enoyl-CoA hydratase/isomerase family protein [Cupriavidus sp. D39]